LFIFLSFCMYISIFVKRKNRKFSVRIFYDKNTFIFLILDCFFYHIVPAPKGNKRNKRWRCPGLGHLP
jgi:hypothetical protein